MSKIDDAVQNVLDEISRAQVAVRLLRELGHFVREGTYIGDADEINHAFTLLSLKIHEQLAKAWQDLTWFSTVDMKAKKTVNEMAKSWFERNDTEIMGFIGQSGRYYTADEKSFRNELRKAFGIEKDDE